MSREPTDIQKNDMRERLKKISNKKIETTMVYPLHQFEMEFGHMWGHGKKDSELTSQEKVNLEKWKRCRNNIFNNGNQQKRGLCAELDMHTVIWNRYETILIPVDKGGHNG